ncbi:Pleckstrin homology domain [Rhizoctonia solani]|uniref:Pleckstrin homology domain n=1 Tax=Rhizoctonia solani TaxID=456999 RepID=A0A8H7IEI1_9AGAM|nr:Pleckstrin homology domain [Rhizoctonia solani]
MTAEKFHIESAVSGVCLQNSTLKVGPAFESTGFFSHHGALLRAQGTASELNIDQPPRIRRSSLKRHRSHIEDATQAITVPGSEDTAKAFAERAWQEDPSFVEREGLVEWLGSPLVDLTIDDAIRQLCNKLYIKGETQQMDRVLEAFSEHYVTQNAASIWRIADIVHVVSFAIILFDTGLQSAEFNTPTISRWFVESTIEAIRAQLQQGSILKQNGTLKNLLTNSTLASDPLPDIDGSGQLHFSTSPSGKPESLASVNIDRRPSSRGSRTSRDSWIITQSWDTGEPQFGERWFTDISRELSAIYSRIQAKPILQTGRYKDTAASPQSRSESRAIFLSTLGRSGPLLWKPMKPTTGRIAKPKRWLTIIATVRDSIFDMSGPVTPGNSGAAGRRLGALSLLHSLAIEFPTPKGTKVRSFGLTLASGETHVFEIQAPEGVFSKSKSKRRADPDAEVSAWVRACNYHAARYSRAPLPNAVTNAEYGWNGVTEVDDGQDSTKGHARNVVIEDWVAPNLPAMEAQTDVEAQFGVWRKQVDIYNLEFAKHSELRGKMMSLYRPGSAEAYKALSNWEKKSQYLLTEMVKYDTYAEFLQYHWCEGYSVNNSSSCYNNISGSVHIDPAIQPSYDASVASDAELTSPSSPASDECETSAPQSLIRDITVGNSPHEALYENLPRSDHDGSQCSNETKDDQQSYSPQYMAFTMYECLVQHGCPDLTSLIDPLGFSSSPVAEGGFGTSGLENTAIAIRSWPSRC